MQPDTDLSRSRLQTPRAAAVAGIVFSVLLASIMVLIRLTVPVNPREAGLLPGGAGTAELAMNLVPFCGIAFLWFIGVLRDRLGTHEDKFFATVFLGSGLLFIGALFASSAVLGTILRMHRTAPDVLIASGLYGFNRTLMYEIVSVYTIKMAGVFVISTSTLSIRTGIVPRWMAFVGFVLAVFLLLGAGTIDWAPFVFPAWVSLISLHILLANLGRRQ